MTKTKTNEELMKNYQQLLQFAQNSLANAEMQLKRVKLTLEQLASFDPENPESLSAYLEETRASMPEELNAYKDEDAEVVEGVFD
jgi:cysteinyl-tRNA synthetase